MSLLSRREVLFRSLPVLAVGAGVLSGTAEGKEGKAAKGSGEMIWWDGKKYGFEELEGLLGGMGGNLGAAWISCPAAEGDSAGEKSRSLPDAEGPMVSGVIRREALPDVEWKVQFAVQQLFRGGDIVSTEASRNYSYVNGTGLPAQAEVLPVVLPAGKGEDPKVARLLLETRWWIHYVDRNDEGKWQLYSRCYLGWVRVAGDGSVVFAEEFKELESDEALKREDGLVFEEAEGGKLGAPRVEIVPGAAAGIYWSVEGRERLVRIAAAREGTLPVLRKSGDYRVAAYGCSRSDDAEGAKPVYQVAVYGTRKMESGETVPCAAVRGFDTETAMWEVFARLAADPEKVERVVKGEGLSDRQWARWKFYLPEPLK